MCRDADTFTSVMETEGPRVYDMASGAEGFLASVHEARIFPI